MIDSSLSLFASQTSQLFPEMAGGSGITITKSLQVVTEEGDSVDLSPEAQQVLQMIESGRISNSGGADVTLPSKSSDISLNGNSISIRGSQCLTESSLAHTSSSGTAGNSETTNASSFVVQWSEGAESGSFEIETETAVHSNAPLCMPVSAGLVVATTGNNPSDETWSISRTNDASATLSATGPGSSAYFGATNDPARAALTLLQGRPRASLTLAETAQTQ